MAFEGSDREEIFNIYEESMNSSDHETQIRPKITKSGLKPLQGKYLWDVAIHSHASEVLKETHNIIEKDVKFQFRGESGSNNSNRSPGEQKTLRNKENYEIKATKEIPKRWSDDSHISERRGVRLSGESAVVPLRSSLNKLDSLNYFFNGNVPDNIDINSIDRRQMNKLSDIFENNRKRLQIMSRETESEIIRQTPVKDNIIKKKKFSFGGQESKKIENGFTRYQDEGKWNQLKKIKLERLIPFKLEPEEEHLDKWKGENSTIGEIALTPNQQDIKKEIEYMKHLLLVKDEQMQLLKYKNAKHLQQINDFGIKNEMCIQESNQKSRHYEAKLRRFKDSGYFEKQGSEKLVKDRGLLIQSKDSDSSFDRSKNRKLKKRHYNEFESHLYSTQNKSNLAMLKNGFSQEMKKTSNRIVNKQKIYYDRKKKSECSDDSYIPSPDVSNRRSKKIKKDQINSTKHKSGDGQYKDKRQKRKRVRIRKPLEFKDDDPNQVIGVTCKCKNSKCIKLYCHCFASNGYCQSSCKCENCVNKEEFKDVVELVRAEMLQKNPKAFKNKFKKVKKKQSGFLHSRGCNCKQTQCLKNYCECFSAGVGCSALCKCLNCQNKKIDMPYKEAKQYLEKAERKRKKPSEVMKYIINNNLNLDHKSRNLQTIMADKNYQPRQKDKKQTFFKQDEDQKIFYSEDSPERSKDRRSLVASEKARDNNYNQHNEGVLIVGGDDEEGDDVMDDTLVQLQRLRHE